MKRFCSILLLLSSLYAPAQLVSPEQFLGYKVGTRYTPHFRIVDYFKAAAVALPGMVKVQQYGTTNEGRPLIAAFVSSQQNIADLESIRAKNMELTGASEKSKAGAPSVVITWLSYNVHGNETSSSEAAMLTLYALLDPTNSQTKTWLQNSVVVIDPCLNPDGRDRYVNWFNSVVGKNFNPSPESREHKEPWPGGRSNHYNFDLNRDWAWQTQVETQQRLALYNRWLPQIHVDFHEQGFNDPYYFAPAAEPFHEVITPWQREFQTIIGRNHAKYFDANGWLYFTKERFDLLYPSYGDTYPIYNGSIGMTYEQGGIGAGLGVVTESGDTMTLSDRVQHHFTTGLSTVEVASKNAGRLLTEYEKFFREAANGIGEYKAYVIRGKENEARLQALAQLLDKNEIRYYAGKQASLRGLNYHTLKEESFTLSSTDLVIPSAQPKAALVKVLFEQSTKLSDSATYDITAWSLPYAYGLLAYATKTPLSGLQAYSPDKNLNTAITESPYAYVIPWTGINSAKLAGQLLQKGVKLRFARQPFTAGNQSFGRGSVLIIGSANKQINNLWSMVRTAATEADVKLAQVSSGFVEKGLDFGSSSVVPMKARRVAMFTGEGISSLAAGEVWFYFEQVLNYPVTLIYANDAARMNWSNYDVVIMPDGMFRFLSDKASADALKNWVNNGGNLIAMESAVSGLSRLDWSVKAKKSEDSNSKDKDSYDNLRRYSDKEREALKDYTPGSIYKVELDNTHPLAFGYPDFYYTLKMDNNQYEFLKDGGWNVGVVKKDGPLSGFVGNTLNKRLRNHLVFGVQEIGRGTVTYLTDDVLFRSFWENGKLLFANAVFLVGQ